MFEHKRQGAIDVVSGGDRISGDHVAELGTVLSECLKRGGQPRVVLDLQGVALVDSAGLELLLDTHEECQRHGRRDEAGESRCAVQRSAQGDRRRRAGSKYLATRVARCGASCYEYAHGRNVESRLPPVASTATAPRAGTLGQLLVGADVITPEQLDQALAAGSQKGLRLGEALVDMGMVQEEAILPFIEGHLGVPATRLRDGMIDPIAVRLMPRRVAERLDALALFKVRDTLCVAMADPQNLEQVDEIERITQLRVRPVFSFRSSIQRTLPRCYDEGFEVDTVTADIDEVGRPALRPTAPTST